MVKGSTIALAAIGIGFALFVHAGGVDILRKFRAGEHMYAPTTANYARQAYEANSFYRDLGLNPYYMGYGPYGKYYGRGYDDYLSNPSPK